MDTNTQVISDALAQRCIDATMNLEDKEQVDIIAAIIANLAQYLADFGS